MKAQQVTVRPVQVHEISRIIEFLRTESDRLARRTADSLRVLFEYRWATSQAKPNLGFALWSGNEVVGFLGAIYANRLSGGQPVKTCNLSAWYVKSEFRWASLKLLHEVMSQQDYSITNFTPSSGVRKIMEALRFEIIDRCKYVYLPWHFRREIFRCGPDLLTNTSDVARVLKGSDSQFLRDHQPYRLKHYLYREGSDYSYFILKRRLFPGEAAFSRIPIRKLSLIWYPCMEVLYLSSPLPALHRWGGIVSSILRRERVLAVVVPERFLGANAPASARLEHRNYLLAREPLHATLDSLYSELAILPF